MKKNLILILLNIFVAVSFAQNLTPVKWTFEQEDLGNNEFNLIFKASIIDGWYLYSQFNDPMGPVPTSFTYKDKRSVDIVGKVSEKSPKTVQGYDEMFEMDIKKFSKSAVFKQKVKLTGAAGKVKGYLEFMSCNDEMCLPPETIDFDFILAKQTKATPAVEVKEAVKEEVKKIEEKIEKAVETVKNEVSEVENEINKIGDNGKGNIILEPVKWTVSAEKKEANKVVLSFVAKIDKNWGLYAQEQPKEGGPVPTAFTFEENANVTLKAGALTEKSDHVFEGFEPLFDMDIKKFKEEVTFSKEININKADGFLKGYLEFMTCDDEQCLAPVFIDFELNLATLETKIGSELDPEILETTESSNTGLIIENLDLKSVVSDCGNVELNEEPQEKQSFWLVFLKGLIGGFIALLTPCVFPMIPLTVSYFTKGKQDKRKGIFDAFLYGFFIIAVYTAISVPFHFIEGISPNILNEISTGVPLNIIFFVIFMVLAFSFFGYYELELPASFAEKSSNAEGIGGFVGIFFMAVTLAIVSFSCTGPILGFLIGSLASTGGASAGQLTAGMAGFGVALALPFTLFALFPSMLKSLPKSGGWMNTVKVVLGFLEVAFAIKFLSNADLVKQWGLLKYEVFIGLWVIIFLATALYLFGIIKFPHDGPIKKLSLGRKLTGTAVMVFVVYLCTAFIFDEKTKTFSSLKLLSGFPPPAGYSWIHVSQCPQNFNCYHDFFEAQEVAKKVGKPMMLDFTGHACVNCRKVEETVWNQESIHKIIDEEYILVSLYVDERIELPIEEQIAVEYNGKVKTLKTVGDKWAFMEYANFAQVSQPFYVLLAPDGTLLNTPMGYSSSSSYIEQYENFLKCGLEAYKSIK